MIGRILLSVFIAAAFTACGPDENGNPNNIDFFTNNGNNTNNTNGGTNNTIVIPNNGFGEECLEVECPAGRRCVRGECVMSNLKVACEEPEELGELTLGEEYSGSADSSGYADGVSTICNADVARSGAEWGLSFTVPEAGNVYFELSNSEAPHQWVVEFREDDCTKGEPLMMNNLMPNAEPGREPRCAEAPELGINVEPDVDYWVLVEPNNSIDTGTFDWTLTYEADDDECERGRVCMDESTVLVCDGNQELPYSCPTGCLDGACGGDACADAIEVTASMTWSGDTGALTSTLDYFDAPNCSEDMTTPTATAGQEMVFFLPGLTSGQTVTIDASMDNNDNVIVVQEECSDTAACVIVQDLTDYLEWNVDADGDYYVVIDKSGSNYEPFMYAIDIQ